MTHSKFEWILTSINILTLRNEKYIHSSYSVHGAIKKYNKQDKFLERGIYETNAAFLVIENHLMKRIRNLSFNVTCISY